MILVFNMENKCKEKVLNSDQFKSEKFRFLADIPHPSKAIDNSKWAHLN